jgi:hypothetical protein
MLHESPVILFREPDTRPRAEEFLTLTEDAGSKLGVKEEMIFRDPSLRDIDFGSAPARY